MPRLLAILLVSLLAAACRETGEVEVSSIDFRGTSAIRADELEEVVSTRAGGFLPWSRKPAFDRVEFERDIRRIEAFYADRGYPEAKVANVDVRLNDEKGTVAITVEISEGDPILVESIGLEGLDAIPADHIERLRSRLPVAPGKPRDQRLILATHDMVVAELRDHGFPFGTVRMVENEGSTDATVRLTVAAEAGPEATFGPVSIEGDVSVDEDVIRRELNFNEGDLYRLSRITESQRRLYSLELFEFVNLTPRLPEGPTSVVPVVVTVAEGKHRRLQLAGGFGSEERARGRINWRHVNVDGSAGTFEVEARASKLEQGVRGSILKPYLLLPGLSVRLSGSTWWADEPIYESRSSGGRLIFAKDFSRTGVGSERGVRNVVSFTVIREYEDYAIAESALEDPTFRDELIALGLDPDTGEGKGTLSAFDLDFERSTSLQPLDPRRGYAISAHMEIAGAVLGGSFHYSEFIGEARKYFELAPRVVWANRVRAGTLGGVASAEIPFYKRYFVGGASSVRGWGRYQVSPLSPDGLPIGGRTMMDLSTEARFGIHGKLNGVLFVDGGNSWLEPFSVQLKSLRWAAGPGIRYDTPIGPLRVDLGVQLTPIDGLVIEGTPEKRKWRVHFSIGQAF